MTGNERLLLRLAVAMHEPLGSGQSTSAQVELPTASWQQGEHLLRRIHRARQRGWQLAAQRLQRELQEVLCRLQGELITIDHLLEPRRNELHSASIVDIHADLVALHEDFEDVSFDRRERTISVTTEPIELDDIYLGPFEIRLDWSNLADGHPHNYRVIAVDANPAAANESVTHPHVQDEAVCEGDGRQPIRKALEQGRLLDFFTIVANLLRTYNAGSPYVSLSDWYGVECADCGSTVSDDERWTCELCGAYVCGDCYVSCPGCDGLFCGACVTRCAGCEENHCGACMKHCAGCRAELCPGCLEENERCSDCHDQETEETNEELVAAEESSGNSAALAPLQPDRVGQAAVPA
ncbi:MAG: hypothetical protein IH899_18860 [Planctomycetes bacterium]|nr:hypothetical protein [Planctomycetota bacterium]